MCACVHVCARVRVCACARKRACLYVFVTNSGSARSSVWYSRVETNTAFTIKEIKNTK